MKTITLEEHFVTKSFLNAVGEMPKALQQMQAKLLDLGAGRIAAMDAAGIDVQVLSLAAIGMDQISPADAVKLIPDINDELAAAVKAHPDRFKGFATLPMHTPDQAASELERCVTKLGFVGALLDGTVDGKFLDDRRFTPVFEAAVKLGVPLYLHPAPPPAAVKQAYYTGVSEIVDYMLSIAGWGWHAETALHTLRLICSGLFDRMPELQIIIGHMGEGLPYALARSSAALSGAAGTRQPVADYFNTNLWVTTSGYFTLPPFTCAREVIGLARLMFSIDYPFSSTDKGRAFLDLAATLLDPAQMQALTHGNAEKVLKLT